MGQQVSIYRLFLKLVLGITVLIFLSFVSDNDDKNKQLPNDVDSLVLRSIKSKSVKAEEYFKITLYLFQQDSLLAAIDYAQKGIKAAEDEGDYNTLGKFYVIKGYIYLSYGTYVKAIYFFSKGEQIGKEHGLDNLVISACHGMGRVYNDLGEHEKALAALYRGLKIAKLDSTSNQISVFYNAIGVSFQAQAKYDSSLTCFNKYYQKSILRSDTLSMIYALVNIGEVYRIENDFKTAKEYYFKAEDLNKTINNTQAQAAIYGNLSNIYSDQKKYKLAISYLKKSIQLCSSNDGLSAYLLEDYKSIVDDYAALSKFDSAYVYYKYYTAFRDSVYERDRIKNIDNIRSAYQIAEIETHTKILTQKLRTRTMILIFSVSLSILIVLLLILTYSRYKLKTRVYKEEAIALNLTIDEKNRELVTKVMSQNRQEEVYDEVGQILTSLEISNNPNRLKEELEFIKKKLSQNSKTGMGWESFKMHFENVHPDFFGKLLKQCNVLTQNDLRTCAYIKLNLSTKDIANILNVSVRTIQTSRYRIKKKLNLPVEVNLVQFIQGL